MISVGRFLKVREDDLAGLENHFQCHLRDRHALLQFFKPVQHSDDLGCGCVSFPISDKCDDQETLPVRGDIVGTQGLLSFGAASEPAFERRDFDCDLEKVPKFSIL